MITYKEVQSALDALQTKEIISIISPDGTCAYIGTEDRLYFRYVTEEELSSFMNSIVPPH